MAKKFREKLRKFNPFTRPMTLDELPKPLPANPDLRLVKVYVEGYEDVAFWRGIFDHFQNPYLRFEISVPDRGDLPKGKKVLMGMIPRSSEELLLCVDSDFDYLFAGRTPQSKEVAEAKFMFHTYAYATENYLCYAPSLHNVCVKATKNDTRIFDFVKFMHEYSCTIYPLFLWYAYSAQLATENVFPLIDFKQSVRIGYLDIEDNGSKTIEWLRRNVSKRENLLRQRNPRMIEPMKEFEVQLHARPHADGQRGADHAQHRVREAAGHVDRQDHRLEEAGRGAQERDVELHQLAALDPRRAARQRKLHQKPALQTVGTRHRAVYRPHDLEHEAQRRNPRHVDDRHYPQTPHRTAITEKRGAGTRTRSKRIRRLPPMNPALGTGYSRLRTTRTVDCVACRTKTCGPRA